MSDATPRVMRTPRAIDIDITSRCNLRCRYCYFFENPSLVYTDLPTAEWLKFFDELGSLGVMNATLSGGEAFLRKDLARLLDGLVRNRMRFSILSNGALITKEMAGRIARTRRCDYVQVSVDGSRPEVHDAFRGAGAFEAAIRGIRVLQAAGVNVTVRVTVHRRNVDDLESIVRLLLDELRIPVIGTNAAGYLGNCRTRSDEVLLNTEERFKAMKSLLQLADRYRGRITAAAGPLAEGRMWKEMEKKRVQGSGRDEAAGLTGCNCTTSQIAVRSDGVIVPCGFLSHIELGRINRDSLQAIWLNSAELRKLRTRSSIKLSDLSFCQGCSYISSCTGNCPGLAYSISGKVDWPNPDGCLRRYLESGGLLP